MKIAFNLLKTNVQLILNSNKKDVSNAKFKKIKHNMIDRLKLNNKKIEQIRNSIKDNQHDSYPYFQQIEHNLHHIFSF